MVYITGALNGSISKVYPTVMENRIVVLNLIFTFNYISKDMWES